MHPAVAELRGHLAAADALLLCTPEYAGALPGALKSLRHRRRRLHAFPVLRDAIEQDGTVADPTIRKQIADTLATLVHHAAAADASP